MKKIVFLLVCLFTLNTALAHEITSNEVTAEHPWARATAPGAPNGAVYMKIHNMTDEKLVLVSASSDVAEKVEIQNMTMTDGVMKMFALEDGLEVNANDHAELAPHGLHVMLLGIRQPLVEGESFPLTLNFSNDSALEVMVNIYSDEEQSTNAHNGH